VCDADLDLLQSLVEKSLVRRTDERFWMLETIREFAGERLEASGEAEAARRRHAQYFLRVAESTCLATERVGTGPMRYDVALAEQENFRAALDWALAVDPELGLRIAVELEQFWVSADPFEGRRRIAALLDAAGELPPALRAAGLRVLAGASSVSGDGEAALRLNEESLALYEQLGDEHGVVALRHRIAVSALLAGDLDRGRTLVEGNLVRARALGSLYLETENTGTLGYIEMLSGNLETAIELYRGHLDLSRELGFVWFQGIALANLTELSFKLTRMDEAEEYGRSSLRLAAEMQDRLLTAGTLALLGVIARAKGDAGRAGRLWGAVAAEGERGSFGWQQAEIDGFGAEVMTEATPELEEAISAGRRLSLAEATEYALG
jgi:tetratricopeptide (TPR) repeat protein